MPWITLAEALKLAGGDKERLRDAFAAEDVPTRRRREDGTVQKLRGALWWRGAEIDWEGSRLNVGQRSYHSSKHPPSFVSVEVDLCKLLEWLNAAQPSEGEAMLRSGAPGRPTSMHLVEGELERRIAAGKKWPSKQSAAEELSEWLRDKHPNMPVLTPKTIKNKLTHKILLLPKTPPGNTARN